MRRHVGAARCAACQVALMLPEFSVYVLAPGHNATKVESFGSFGAAAGGAFGNTTFVPTAVVELETRTEAWGNLWTALLVAFGKLAAVFSASRPPACRTRACV